MSSKPQNSLSARLILTIALSALIIIIVSSLILYQVSFEDQLRRADNNLKQLVSAVQHTSAIAAYLGDKELAKEVVFGLSNNDIVDGVLIINNESVLYSDGNMEAATGQFSQRFTLISPFIEKEKVGELIINPNRLLMKDIAASNARRFVLTMMIYTLIILGMLIPLVNWQITGPIKRVAHQLHLLEPGSSDRLQCPEAHQENEIGGLVRDSNQLLASVQNTLEEERKLRHIVEQLQNKFRLIFENASCGIALIDYEARVQIHNSSFARLINDEYLNTSDHTNPLSLTQFFNDDELFRDVIEQTLQSEQPIGIDLETRRGDKKQSQWLHCLLSKVTDESIGSFVELIVYDISERTHREKQAQIAAEHDPLTQLYNRRAGVLRMQDALDIAMTEHNQCALMMIDLDRFKPINDLYGHEAGDFVLVEIAHRMHKCVRGEDMVIRWGGDEFLIFLQSGEEKLNPIPVAKKILSQLSQPIRLDNNIEVNVGASIGIALYPDHSDNLVNLIEIADDHMYQIKNEGRNGYKLAS
ncbi:MAG: diguanylate cyclase [Gammaproteobacteria bacterium]|nr:diguanylate cyclase [Gammaproteobacteria bacterium]